MVRIKGLKTGQEQVLTDAEFDKLKKSGASRDFKVIERFEDMHEKAIGKPVEVFKIDLQTIKTIKSEKPISKAKRQKTISEDSEQS